MEPYPDMRETARIGTMIDCMRMVSCVRPNIKIKMGARLVVPIPIANKRNQIKGSSAHFALFDLWMNNPNGKPASNVIKSPSKENPSVLARSSAKDSESAEVATAENGGRMNGWWITLASISQNRNNTTKGIVW